MIVTKFNKDMIYKINGRHEWSYTDEFIAYLKYKLQNPISVSGLAKKVGMSYGALKGIIEKNGMEILKMPNSAEFKAIYQDYDWCYKKYMDKGLNHEEMAKEANCSVRVIEKWCSEIYKLDQKYRQKYKQLNNMQEDLIIGSLLGDGHIDKRKTQPVFIVSHAEDQKDYLYWKYNILKDLCNKEPSYIPTSMKEFQGKSYKCQPSYRLCTRIYDCLLRYRRMSVTELLDNLNETSLSIWILDDASRGASNWELCIAEMEDKADYIQSTLYKKFNIHCTQKKDLRYITFDAVSSRNIDQIILRSIPNDLDIIQNKIINNHIVPPLRRRRDDIDIYCVSCAHRAVFAG